MLFRRSWRKRISDPGSAWSLHRMNLFCSTKLFAKWIGKCFAIEYMGKILTSSASPDQNLQDKAWDTINYFLAHDIYRCNMMLEALSKTAFASTINFSEFSAAARQQCKPKDDGGFMETIYRHFHKTDSQLHLVRLSSRKSTYSYLAYSHSRTLLTVIIFATAWKNRN